MRGEESCRVGKVRRGTWGGVLKGRGAGWQES